MAYSPDLPPNDLEFIGHIVRDKLDEQPWYKKTANTISAATGALVSVATMVVAVGIDLPDAALIGLVALTAGGTAMGVRGTKNGFSESQRRKLTQWQAEYIDARHSHDEIATPAPSTKVQGQEATPQPYQGRHRLPIDPAADLTRMVESYRRGAGWGRPDGED